MSATSSVYVYMGLADSGLTRFDLAPHSTYSYYTYDGSTEQRTSNSAGFTSFATYDIVWGPTNVRYYQNGVLRATHTNPPSVAMGAYLRAYTTSAYGRCDWVFIHKYASADPSVTFGSEESAGADSQPPVITIVSPLNGAVLSVNTSSVVITVSTDENANCRYSLTNSSFDYLTGGTDFSTARGLCSIASPFLGCRTGKITLCSIRQKTFTET